MSENADFTPEQLAYGAGMTKGYEIWREEKDLHAGRAEIARKALQRIAEWDYQGETAEEIARAALILTEVKEYE